MLARHEFTVVDENGNIVTDAQVEVRREIPGQQLAVLYSDRDGNAPLGNPFNVDAQTAVAAFHVIGGPYQIRAFKSGFERIERYVGIGTASETDAGLLAVAVPPTWLFDNATADADPGDGEFRLNNADPASATAAYIDNLAFGGVNVSAWLDTLDDSADSTRRGILTIFDPTAPTTIFRAYAVPGSVVDGTGYRKLTIAHIAGAGSFTTGMQYQISFAASGPLPANYVAKSGDTMTGQLAVAFGLAADDFTTYLDLRSGDFGVGKPGLQLQRRVATDHLAFSLWDGATTDGTFEILAGSFKYNGNAVTTKATDANVRAAAAGNLAVTTDLLESASAAVTLTETAGAIAVDWDTFIYGVVTIDENSTLSNPTNQQPGTWRSIRVLGNDATLRTLAFGANYQGELPALADINSTKQYLLMLFAIDSTNIAVKAIVLFD